VPEYEFTVDIAAPREQVFKLWTDLDRAPEWIEGLAGYSDVSGPPDAVGTSYTAKFGEWSTSITTVVEADPPRYIRVKFGNWFLRGEQSATFGETPAGTRLTQLFRTEGLIPAITARIFASGSYKGSFRGELETFRKICEREAAAAVTP
jgi:uncharacterized protein YndB with AHSA1/START domain